jgi:pSer/pThr/pTyr-binding forkhead associated (FHA) protein
VRSGRGEGTTIDCRRVVTILGSRKGCKVNLRHPKISAVHVAIVNTGSDVFAVDLVTKSGTLLNGLHMEHERLSDDDILTVGPWRLRVEIQKPGVRGQDDLHPFDLEPSPHVVALELVATGRILRPNRDVCLVGRRSGCDITISDRRISRAHALLLTYFGQPAIVDLLSQNQTHVNDVPVRFKPLVNDDVITVGETQFRAKLVGSAVSEKNSNGRKAGEGKIVLAPPEECTDQINIEEVEGSQRWRIADSAKRAARNK